MGNESPLILYTLGGDSIDLLLSPPPTITMQTFLTAEEILQLVTTGVVNLSDDLIVRMSESYEDSDWYNDPNCVMSRHHY